MRKEPDSRDGAEEGSINWLQPVVFGAVLNKVSQGVVSTIDQFSALGYVVVLAIIDLADRRVFFICRHAEKLTKQIHCFANMTMDETD